MLCNSAFFRTTVSGILSCHLIYNSFLQQLKKEMVKSLCMMLVYCPGLLLGPTGFNWCFFFFLLLRISDCYSVPRDLHHRKKKVQVGKDQEKAQSERDFHSKNRGGKKPNFFPIGGHSVTLT